MVSKKSKRSLWDIKIVRRASWDSIVKLHPVTMMRNPVMFVVEVGSVVTTVLLILERAHGQSGFSFNLQITLWLWFTVLFANFAEAMAEGRGKAQADALRRAKAETMANRLIADGKTETVPGSKLRFGRCGRVYPGRWRDCGRRGICR
jgi:K+-transporting ATPase ATPase B chain